MTWGRSLRTHPTSGRVAIGQARVDETQPVLPYAEDAPGLVHLLPADLGQVGEHLGPLHRGVEDGTPLAPGAGHHHDVDAGRHVARHSRGALARLVVLSLIHISEPTRPY